MFDENELRHNWQFLKTEVLKKWNRLAEADVENAHGNLQALNKLIDKEYGENSNFKEEIESIYRNLQTIHYEKKTRPTNAGQRDNSPERRLNENYSRINSPEEVAEGKTNTPTIHEENSTRH